MSGQLASPANWQPHPERSTPGHGAGGLPGGAGAHGARRTSGSSSWAVRLWCPACSRRTMKAEAGMPDQSDDVAHAVSGPAPAPDNRPAGGAIRAAGTGTGRSEGFLKPVYYARSRDRYRPPPDLYRRLNRWLGPAVTSSGLSPRDVITLEVPGRRSGVVRRTTLVRIACDGEHYVVALAGESQWVRNVRAAGGRVVLGRRERRAARLVEVPPEQRAAVIRAYLLRRGRRPAPGRWPGRPAFTSASARRRRCGKSRMS